jgi:type I restriction enzyme S subunit
MFKFKENILYLNFESIKTWADRVALGNAQKTVTLGELTKFPITLPTLVEQRALLNCLKQSNSLIDQNSELKKKYCTAKKGLMQDLLTGKVQVTA